MAKRADTKVNKSFAGVKQLSDTGVKKLKRFKNKKKPKKKDPLEPLIKYDPEDPVNHGKFLIGNCFRREYRLILEDRTYENFCNKVREQKAVVGYVLNQLMEKYTNGEIEVQIDKKKVKQWVNTNATQATVCPVCEHYT